jgi:hypothetical protein
MAGAGNQERRGSMRRVGVSCGFCLAGVVSFASEEVRVDASDPDISVRLEEWPGTRGLEGACQWPGPEVER